jgi:hypothetical protein
MTKVIVDSATREQLVSAKKPLELCDETGCLLGHFIPALTASQCGTGPQISEAELDRREQAGGGRPLAEILEELGRQG